MYNKSIDPFLGSDDEFKKKIIDYVLHPPIEDEVQVIEVINVEDDTEPFPKIEQEKMKIDQTPQITEEMEYYENFELSPDEIAEGERMIREDRKNELRKLAFNKHLHQETYYLINKQFEREIERHHPKVVTERNFNNKPEDYPNVLMINEPVDWEASQNNLTTRPYTQPLYQGGALEDDFGIRYHFNQIRSFNKLNPVLMEIYNVDSEWESEKMYVPTDIIGAFRYVLNKERNISSTWAVNIKAGLTIQIEKHSKTFIKNYVPNYSVLDDYVTYEIRHDYQDQSKMLPYLYVFPTKEEETQKYIDYLNGYVSQILEHI
jgi:hypothetical protein